MTLEQAKQYLKSQGMDSIADFIVIALLEQIAVADECMQLNYTDGQRMLITAYLLSLLAMAQTDKFLASQSAPSGASRSFRYHTFNDRWKAQLSLLKAIDKSGCVTDLVPVNPFAYEGGLWVSPRPDK